MTAPAELSNRPVADAAKVRPADTAKARPAAPTPPLPASPRLPWASSVPVALRNAPGFAFVRPARAVHLAAAVAVTLAVVGGLGWLGRHAGAGAGIPAETTIVRVGTGETVWDVAQRVAPEADARAVVQRIRQLNGMVGSAVQPGQRLQVPDGR